VARVRSRASVSADRDRPSKPRVGLAGCGVLGRTFGVRLLEAGHDLAVFDRERDAAGTLLDLGAVWANSPAELASTSDLTVSCLPGPQDVESVALGRSGLFANAAPRTVHVETSTVGRSCVLKLEREASAAGIRLIDAPVSRGKARDDETDEAEQVLWVGATVDHFDLARPVLDVLADRVIYCGAVGLGQATKIVNNLIAHALLLVVGEALTLGVRAGANLDLLSTALQHGTGQTRILDELFPASLFQGDFRPGLRLDLALKDLDLANELAGEEDLELILSGPIREWFKRSCARGWGDRSAHSVVRLIEERNGVRLRSSSAPSEPDGN